jgi:hypothetical protein
MAGQAIQALAEGGIQAFDESRVDGAMPLGGLNETCYPLLFPCTMRQVKDAAEGG